MSARNSLNLRRWGKEWGGPLDMARRWKIECFEFTTEGSYWTAIADIKGREFQIVGAATEKLLEPKHVRTRGTDNRLVSDERNVGDGM